MSTATGYEKCVICGATFNSGSRCLACFESAAKSNSFLAPLQSVETAEDFARHLISWWPEDQRHPLPTLIAAVRSYAEAVRADERRKCFAEWEEVDCSYGCAIRMQCLLPDTLARAEKAERERDALRDQIDRGGCAAAHEGETTYECRADALCGLCRLRHRAEKAERERDELLAKGRATAEQRDQLEDMARCLTAERDAALARLAAAESDLESAMLWIERHQCK